MTYKTRFFRVAWTLLIPLLVAACETVPKNLDQRRGSAGPNLSLTPKDADGILIIGLRTRRHPPVHKMEFRSYDPATKRLVPEVQGAKIIRLHSGGTFFEKDFSAEKKNVRYLVQRLPAGFYYMTTVFFGNASKNMSEGSLALEVKPGHVNYIGNVLLQVPFFVFQDITIRPLGRDNEFAADIMKKYKSVTSDIDYQKMTIFKLNCDMKSSLKNCY